MTSCASTSTKVPAKNNYRQKPAFLILEDDFSYTYYSSNFPIQKVMPWGHVIFQNRSRLSMTNRPHLSTGMTLAAGRVIKAGHRHILRAAITVSRVLAILRLQELPAGLCPRWACCIPVAGVRDGSHCKCSGVVRLCNRWSKQYGRAALAPKSGTPGGMGVTW